MIKTMYIEGNTLQCYLVQETGMDAKRLLSPVL